MRDAVDGDGGQENHRQGLIAILQLAYSGEKAAGYAYQGHWRSVRDANQRFAIRRIEREEWHHRREVGRMLGELGAAPLWWREVLMAVIGRSVAVGCFLIGWFWPMYLAGKLENDNVNEYDVAARHAAALGMNEMRDELVQFGVTEHKHEAFFSAMVLKHPWLPFAKRIVGWEPHEQPEMAAQELLRGHEPEALDESGAPNVVAEDQRSSAKNL